MSHAARWLGLALALVSLVGSSAIPGSAAEAQRRFQPEPIAPDAYEPDDSPEQANLLLLVGIRQNRTFHSGDDNDWVYFDLEAGERLVLFTSGSICDTYLYLYAPDGATILAEDDDSGQGANAAIRYAVSQGGAYYARVRQFDPSSPCGPYELVGGIVPPPVADLFEPDNSAPEAKPLELDGKPQEHSLHEPGDQDWVVFAVAANTGIRLETGGACDTYLYLYAPDGRTVLAEDDDSGQFGASVILYTAIEPGAYYARVRHFDESGGVCDQYQLTGTVTLPSLPDAYEPDDSFAQAKPLPLDGTPQMRSFHIPGDVDWVSFRLDANDRVFLFTEGSCDTFLTLYSPDSRVILAEDDDSGGRGNAAILYAVPEPGVYFARVRQFGQSMRTCPSYQLTGAVVSAAKTPTPTVRPFATPTAAPPTPAPTRTPTRTPR